MSNKTSVIYISYDGMTDPLGQSQVLSYVRRLSLQGYAVHIISFEKAKAFEKHRERIEEYINGFDIIWHPASVYQ